MNPSATNSRNRVLSLFAAMTSKIWPSQNLPRFSSRSTGTVLQNAKPLSDLSAQQCSTLDRVLTRRRGPEPHFRTIFSLYQAMDRHSFPCGGRLSDCLPEDWRRNAPTEHNAGSCLPLHVLAFALCDTEPPARERRCSPGGSATASIFPSLV